MKRVALVCRMMTAILLLALAAVPPANAASSAPQAEPSPTPAEVGALQALYEATNGAAWTNRTGWLAGNACGWYGVHCETASAEVAHVASLSLGSNNLTGTLPAALGGLAWLKHLDLAANSLTGPIPASLGGIATLEGLWLDQNQLSGPIPAELLARTSLVQLSLGHNRLEGPLPAFGALADLAELYLNDNRIGGPIPVSIGNLTGVVAMSLGGNQFSGALPASVGQLLKLQRLDLSNNLLEGPLPAALGSLPTLTSLNLHVEPPDGLDSPGADRPGRAAAAPHRGQPAQRVHPRSRREPVAEAAVPLAGEQRPGGRPPAATGEPARPAGAGRLRQRAHRTDPARVGQPGPAHLPLHQR